MPNFKPTLANEFAYATECQLATLVGLTMVKRTSKHEIKRQKSLCLRMLRVYQEYGSEIDWGRNPRLPHFGRVAELVHGVNLEARLDAWLEEEKP
jgi:hypothetical protein